MAFTAIASVEKKIKTKQYISRTRWVEKDSRYVPGLEAAGRRSKPTFGISADTIRISIHGLSFSRAKLENQFQLVAGSTTLKVREPSDSKLRQNPVVRNRCRGRETRSRICDRVVAAGTRGIKRDDSFDAAFRNWVLFSLTFPFDPRGEERKRARDLSGFRRRREHTSGFSELAWRSETLSGARGEESALFRLFDRWNETMRSRRCRVPCVSDER